VRIQLSIKVFSHEKGVLLHRKGDQWLSCGGGLLLENSIAFTVRQMILRMYGDSILVKEIREKWAEIYGEHIVLFVDAIVEGHVNNLNPLVDIYKWFHYMPANLSPIVEEMMRH
jgi:hypothetical protein